MWLLVDVAGILSLTGLHGEEEVGDTHLEDEEEEEEGQGLSCVDTSNFTWPPGVCLCGLFSAALGRRQTKTSVKRLDHRCLIFTFILITFIGGPFYTNSITSS